MIKFENKITNAIFRELVGLGLKKTVCTYQYMGERVGIPYQHDAMGEFLGEISEYFYENYGVLITVLIVKSDTGKPGDGLANLAWNLNHPNINNPNFYQTERDATFKLLKKLQKKGEV